MIKHYCDMCGSELTDKNRPQGGSIGKDRLGVEMKGKNGTTLKLELITSLNGVANQGEFCKYCIIDAFKKLDGRPQLA